MPKNVYNLCKNLCDTTCKTCVEFYTFCKKAQNYFSNAWKTVSFAHFSASFPTVFTHNFDLCFLTNFSTFYTRPITIITNIFNNKVEEE